MEESFFFFHSLKAELPSLAHFKKTPLISLFLFFCVFLCVPYAFATDYYFSTSGNNSNPCTEAKPCQTIGKANSLFLQPGDNVYFKRGDIWSRSNGYLDSILRPQSGSFSADVTYGAYGSGNLPVFDGEHDSGQFSLIWIASASHPKSNITIENLHLKRSYNYAIHTGGNTGEHITISNVTMESCGAPGQSGGGVTATMVSNFTVQNCTISNPSEAGIVFNGTSSNSSHDTKIDNCTITNAGTDGISLHEGGTNPYYMLGDRHLITNNTVTCGGSGENAYDITSGRYVVLRGNTGYNCPDPVVLLSAGHNPPPNQDNFIRWVLVEQNTFRDTASGSEMIHIGGCDNGPFFYRKNTFYGSGEHAGRSYGTCSNLADRLYVYHNTVDMRELSESAPVAFQWQQFDDHLHIKNNIFYTNAAADRAITWGSAVSPTGNNRDSDYNLFYNTAEDPWEACYYGSNKTISTFCSSYSEECNSVQGNPAFNDVASRDYSLESGSAAIDAGGWLTTIKSATGSGSTFTVADANWFYDGWGISGESGDRIKTENGHTAIVTSVDYASYRITLDRPIRWTQNEGIALDYNGARPDIGAYEHPRGGSEQIKLSAPKNLRIE